MPNRSSGSEHAGQSKRGFAGMDPDKQRDIAAKGGESVDPQDRSFSKDHELAAEAGRKGGHASHGGGGQGSSDSTRGGTREQHAEAGRKGGQASHGGTHR